MWILHSKGFLIACHLRQYLFFCLVDQLYYNEKSVQEKKILTGEEKREEKTKQ